MTGWELLLLLVVRQAFPFHTNFWRLYVFSIKGASYYGVMNWLEWDLARKTDQRSSKHC